MIKPDLCAAVSASDAVMPSLRPMTSNWLGSAACAFGTAESRIIPTRRPRKTERIVISNTFGAEPTFRIVSVATVDRRFAPPLAPKATSIPERPLQFPDVLKHLRNRWLSLHEPAGRRVGKEWFST